MLKLPGVRQRLPDEVPQGSAEDAAHVGRQILCESLSGWSPQMMSEDGTMASTEPPLEVIATVKNTFIEFEVPQEEPTPELHLRGAQTCLARIAVPSHHTLSVAGSKDKAPVIEEKEVPPETLNPGPQASMAMGGARRWADYTPGASSSPVSFGVAGRVVPSFAKYTPTLASTPQAQQRPQQIPSPTRDSPLHPQAPPPCYAAPQAFEEQKLPPPPGSLGHHVLLAAMTGNLGSAASPMRPPVPVNLPPGCPSAGSLGHGLLDDKGEPACQPCAWFYKTTGCNNGQACRRCHLCPEGELRARKKDKIARLRKQEGAAGGYEGDAS